MQKRGTVFLVLMIMSLLIEAQVIDDFSDGDFTKNPTWVGDTAKFEINESLQLHLNASGADTSVLVTANTRLENTEWNFWIKLTFNTSLNNYARVYLVSNNSNLKNTLTGYFLQIGGSNDSISFYRQTGTQNLELFKGNLSCTNHSTNILRLKMIHDSTGTWTLFSDDLGGTNFAEEGRCVDHLINFTSWFGVYCHYTTSNSTKFYFDDFYIGVIRADTTPPIVDSIILTDSLHYLVVFSEDVSDASAQNIHHYYSMMNGNPVSATPNLIDGKKVLLTFLNPFPNEFSDTLVITGIQDLIGNAIPDTKVTFCNYKEKAWDVIMDEIMADPVPSTGLPESEYVELYNRTWFPINLAGWIFEYGSSQNTFPDVTISPHGFLILTKGNPLNNYGKCVDLFTSSTTLSNEGNTLVLKNTSGRVIHSVTYRSDWYQDPLKDNGGWSLEMIDTENPCGCKENWRASVDVKGGTPGDLNSVHATNPDTVHPYLKSAEIMNDSVVKIEFSESIDSATMNPSNRWNITPGNLMPNRITPVPPSYNSMYLNLPKTLEKNQVYSLVCKTPPVDCAGNQLDTIKQVNIGIPDSVLAGDIVINEALVYPAANGERFIELYNRSGKILNLHELAIGMFDSVQNLIINSEPLFENSLSLFPGEYSVLTKSAEDIMKRYYCPNPDAFLEMTTFPTFNDTKGTIVLLRERDGAIIDIVSYSQTMYSDLLISASGVSLERINPELPSNEITNWHSASESCGFATPGYKNSEYLQINPAGNLAHLSSIIFTPDDDGKDDVLMIGFTLNDPGYLVSINIFDIKENLIRVLVKNELVSTSDGIIWDGKNDKNQKSPIGMYTLYIELIKPEGKVLTVKKTCILGGTR